MITSERDEYVAGHTTGDVRSALDAEASSQGASRSMVIHRAIVEYLKARGHEVTEEYEEASQGCDDDVQREDGGPAEPAA